jgi:hypothetical protein
LLFPSSPSAQFKAEAVRLAEKREKPEEKYDREPQETQVSWV